MKSGGGEAVVEWIAERKRMKTFSDRDFERFSRMIYAKCGIHLKPHKKNMLEARLRKRLRRLGIETFAEYADFVFSDEGHAVELVPLIDEVTTNKTDFFREKTHFDFLLGGGIEDLTQRYGAGTDRPLRVWSAGCSSGEEPYTLAMTLSEHRERVGGEYEFSILATDISTRVLERARLGIYPEEKIEPVAEPLRRKYLLRSKDRERGQVRIAPTLRARVRFQRLNFMDEDWGLREAFDLLFCRNVLIYFDRATQLALLQRFCRQLPPGRLLFLGHSESLHGLGLPLVQLAPSIYRRV
jgi:chemotaxis protein methyltransferase CheR